MPGWFGSVGAWNVEISRVVPLCEKGFVLATRRKCAVLTRVLRQGIDDKMVCLFMECVYGQGLFCSINQN